MRWLLLNLIRVSALPRISSLQILASGTIRQWSRNHPVRAQLSIAPQQGGARALTASTAGPCLLVPGVERVKAGNRQEDNYKQVGNLIQEVLRRVSL